MARITVEDCLTKETNRFALVQLAAKRTKQLLHGAKLLLEEKCDNKAVVAALREIADGKVRFMTQDEAKEAERLEAEASQAEAEASAAPGPDVPKIIFEAPPAAAPAASGQGDEEGGDQEGGEDGALSGRNGDNAF